MFSNFGRGWSGWENFVMDARQLSKSWGKAGSWNIWAERKKEMLFDEVKETTKEISIFYRLIDLDGGLICLHRLLPWLVFNPSNI